MERPRRALIVVAGLLAACTAAAPAPEAQSPSPTAVATTSSPRPSRASDPVRAIVIHGTGDVNLDPEYVSGHADNGFAYAWSDVRGLFRNDDLTVVNLECPATAGRGDAQPKSYVFRCDPAGLEPMRRAGVDVASIANNHSLDLGTRALLDTRQGLLDAGIEPVGAGRDLDEARTPVLVEADGRTVAVVAFSEILPASSWAATEDRPGFARGDDTAFMVETVRRAARAADVVVVTIHWGIERSASPTGAQRDRARAMIDAGADVIFGHHPHVLQPLERYKGRPIFYSLGNFVWRRSWPESYDTAVAEVTIGPRGKVRARLIPAYIESSGHPILV